VELSAEAPRLLLIAPALDYHPTNEIVLRFFSRDVEVERYGVGIDWRRDLRVMFRRVNSPVRQGGDSGMSADESPP
jgi:hypothetical protein